MSMIASFIPQLRTMGFFLILITLLAFTAGWLRNEMALVLLGTVFLIILVYCFIGVFLLGIVYRKKGQSLSMIISPETMNAGDKVELCVKTSSGFIPEKNYFFRLPVILVRCELHLETKDARVIRHYVDPGKENFCNFPVSERGAYYSKPRQTSRQSSQGDRLVISDALGLFSLSLPAFQNEGIRLRVVPAPAEESILFSLKSSGSEERAEAHYRKSDDLTDHRPYIPGDDPRRINWKLYSHAPQGDLFVREGEPEPPSHSRLLILVDTEVDRSLYTVDEGRQAIDMLCETALAVALEYKGKGMDIHMGHTGSRIVGEENSSRNLLTPRNVPEPLSSVELACAFAMPFAIFRDSATSRKNKSAEMRKAEMLPALPNMAILILALPRMFVEISAGEYSALEKFIKTREAKQEANIVFLYSHDTGNKKAGSPETGTRRAKALEDAAISCVNLYNGKSGIHAAKMTVPLVKNEEGK